MTGHTAMDAHDGYEPHSHEVRPDHLGVRRDPPACPDPDHAGDPRDGCTACARACEAELTALTDRYTRLLHRQADDERSARAAARRAAWGHVLGVIGRRYWDMIANRDLAPDVRAALYRASQADPAWARTAGSRGLLDTMRGLAVRALAQWDTLAAGAVAEARADPREAEIARLRGVITAAGQALHRALAPLPGQYKGAPCDCPGCGLIRDMDTAGLGPWATDGPVAGRDGRPGVIIGGPDSAARVTVRWDDGTLSEVAAWDVVSQGAEGSQLCGGGTGKTAELGDTLNPGGTFSIGDPAS